MRSCALRKTVSRQLVHERGMDGAHRREYLGGPGCVALPAEFFQSPCLMRKGECADIGGTRGPFVASRTRCGKIAPGERRVDLGHRLGGPYLEQADESRIQIRLTGRAQVLEGRHGRGVDL